MKNVIHILRKYPFWALGLLLICGCDVVQDIISEPSGDMDAPPLHVTMIYPSDCVGDSSYCDSFHIGVRTAEAELGISLTEVAGMESDPAVTEMQLREAAQNSDLVLAAGYQMGAPLAIVAPQFPDVKFAIFDVVLDIPNVASINYKANEGSFLVGAIAALKTETNKIGYIGGADVPLLHEFEAGYVAGIRAINPDAEISVEYISENASGFEQPDRAKEMALAQYASGVDVIYAAAGGSGNGVLEAAQEQGKYIIWVDSNGNYLAPGIVLTSMVKELSASVERVIGETVEDNFMAGVRYLGLEDGGVSYALDEHNETLLSAEILETVESLKAKIIAGEIVVPNEVSLPR
jgi:basic membrane protein A